MRKPPAMGAAPPPAPKQDSNLIVLERDYELITPLFGGGVKAGEVDSYTPIRGTSIRGQLRFWWRATRGAFGTGDAGLAELWKAEEALWGSSKKPSQIEVSVHNIHKGKEFQATDSKNNPVDVGDPDSRVGYAAFPLRKEDSKPAGSVQEHVSFSLTLTFPDDRKEDIEAALWAWDTFGGVGARTRRGFGALHCRDSRPRDETHADLRNWRWTYVDRHQESLSSDFDTYVAAGDFHEHVPHLSKTGPRFRMVPNFGTAYDAWESLIKSLKSFRQKRRQDSNGKPYGRSKWPEPDAIRKATGLSLVTETKDHTTPVHAPAVYKFPRAAFGLPIIFGFKDDDEEVPDPYETTLKPQDHDRFASPLILRPLACERNQFAGLALILEGPKVADIPGQLELKGVPGFIPLADLKSSEARTISHEHPDLDNQTDVLAAFLNTLK